MSLEVDLGSADPPQRSTVDFLAWRGNQKTETQFDRCRQFSFPLQLTLLSVEYSRRAEICGRFWHHGRTSVETRQTDEQCGDVGG